MNEQNYQSWHLISEKEFGCKWIWETIQHYFETQVKVMEKWLLLLFMKQTSISNIIYSAIGQFKSKQESALKALQNILLISSQSKF